MEWERSGEVEFIRHRLGNAEVVFGSRLGGFSQPPYDSLNAGIGTGDQPDLVVRNRAELSRAAGVAPEQVVMARQVHGDGVVRHDAPIFSSDWMDGSLPDSEADAHVTDRPGTGLAILTADCLPIALSGPRGLALAHCGWRGLSLGLAAKAAKMVAASTAVVGPGIGPCCYEVGGDVMKSLGDEHSIVDGNRLDLVRVAVKQLSEAGVGEIDSVNLCTCCDEEKFFSHRRDGPTTGRQATLAWLS